MNLFFFSLFFGCPCGIWKFRGQGLNLSHCSGNPRSLSPLWVSQASNLPLCSNPGCCSQILNPLCYGGNSEKMSLLRPSIFLKESGKKCESLFSLSPPFQPWQSKYILYLIGKFGDTQDFVFEWQHPSWKTKMGVPIVAQQKRIWLGTMKLRVRSLALFSGLRIWHCRELWYRPAATAPIIPLPWEPL